MSQYKKGRNDYEQDNKDHLPDVGLGDVAAVVVDVNLEKVCDNSSESVL